MSLQATALTTATDEELHALIARAQHVLAQRAAKPVKLSTIKVGATIRFLHSSGDILTGTVTQTTRKHVFVRTPQESYHQLDASSIVA